MSEESKVEATTDEVNTDTAAEGAQVSIPKKKKKKWPIIVGVVAVVVIAAGAGFWVWHEQPSFCGAICHTPMDPYVDTWDQTAGEPGVDKWGNEVENTNAMMAIAHKDDDVDCLGCHVPTIEEQVSEGLHWVTGDYVYPLEERDLATLTKFRGAEADEFCLNESCHNMTRQELMQTTSDLKRNVHQPQHGEIDCGECHKGHRASVVYCSQCHSDAEIPDGWLTVAEANKLSTGA